MAQLNNDKNPDGLRVIKTARDIDAINEAVESGYQPLMKKVEPSKEIRSKYAIFKNKKTGEIILLGDLRDDFRRVDFPYKRAYEMEGISLTDFKVLIDWTYYYPYSFKSPFAAYLVPNDIKVGEEVYLEDLIEDHIGKSHSQGNNYRLESCVAIWNGKDFDIQIKYTRMAMG